MSDNNTSDDDIIYPLAQKCAICDGYLCAWDDVENYKGNDTRYRLWMAHKECNEAILTQSPSVTSWNETSDDE